MNLGVEFGEGLDLGVEFGDWIWGLDFWVGFWGFAIDSKLIFHALSAIITETDSFGGIEHGKPHLKNSHGTT